MSQKTIKIIGWVLTGILALLFTMSAFMKLTQNEMALAQASSFGMDPNMFLVIGIIETASLILFLIPRTGILGSLLLIAYMGGAIVTHLLHQQPVGMAVAIQVLVWITAIIRFPELKQRLLSPKN